MWRYINHFYIISFVQKVFGSNGTIKYSTDDGVTVKKILHKQNNIKLVGTISKY